jgi:23S rRNA (pseudouridine1915-N3)-methyltransferase
MEIKVICVGKIKEAYLVDAILEYLKRVKPFVQLNLIEVKEVNTTDVMKNLNEEGKNILTNVNTEDYVITLEIDGKNIDSICFSKLIFEHYTYSSKTITFIIGASDGLSEVVLARSDYKLSFGKMTYPHQLMRVILLEQIYRAIMINNNNKYHK